MLSFFSCLLSAVRFRARGRVTCTLFTRSLIVFNQTPISNSLLLVAPKVIPLDTLLTQVFASALKRSLLKEGGNLVSWSSTKEVWMWGDFEKETGKRNTFYSRCKTISMMSSLPLQFLSRNEPQIRCRRNLVVRCPLTIPVQSVSCAPSRLTIRSNF